MLRSTGDHWQAVLAPASPLRGPPPANSPHTTFHKCSHGARAVSRPRQRPRAGLRSEGGAHHAEGAELGGKHGRGGRVAAGHLHEKVLGVGRGIRLRGHAAAGSEGGQGEGKQRFGDGRTVCRAPARLGNAAVPSQHSVAATVGMQAAHGLVGCPHLKLRRLLRGWRPCSGHESLPSRLLGAERRWPEVRVLRCSIATANCCIATATRQNIHAAALSGALPTPPRPTSTADAHLTQSPSGCTGAPAAPGLSRSATPLCPRCRSPLGRTAAAAWAQ